MRRRVDRRALFVWLAAALAGPAAAQNADAPRAPRILDAPAAQTPERAAPSRTTPLPPTTVGRPPNAARLAPLPEERRGGNEDVEEIIVTGQGWRLPDLGSEWRARQRELERSGRFTVLPLYDPARPPLTAGDLLRNPEQRRHGYVEIFRLRFGRRARD